MNVASRLKQIKAIDNTVNLLSVVLDKGGEKKFTIKASYKGAELLIGDIDRGKFFYLIKTPTRLLQSNKDKLKNFDTLRFALLKDCIEVNAKDLYEPVLFQLIINLKECKRWKEKI